MRELWCVVPTADGKTEIQNGIMIIPVIAMQKSFGALQPVRISEVQTVPVGVQECSRIPDLYLRFIRTFRIRNNRKFQRNFKAVKHSDAIGLQTKSGTEELCLFLARYGDGKLKLCPGIFHFQE